MSQLGSETSKQSSTVGKTESKPAPSWPQIKVLDQLGASRGVKIVVIICLSIFGTMETIFYAKAALRYFYPQRDDEHLE